MKKCMEIVKNRIKDFFKIDGDYKTAKVTLLAVLLVVLTAYNKVFSSVIANPDGIVEGFYSYSNGHWASAGCGRWLIRYFNFLHVNIVSPVLVLIEYMFFTWLTSLTIVNVLGMKKRIFIVLSTIMMCLVPTVIAHMSYTCTASAYAFSGFTAALYVYFLKEKDMKSFVIGTLCLTISLGGYQSYIGLAASLVLMYLIISIINGNDYKCTFKHFGRFVVSAIISCILYFLLLKIDLLIFKLEPISRVSDFSFIDILLQFPSSFVDTYRAFFSVMNDTVLKHNIVFFAFVVVLLVEVLFAVSDFIKEGKYLNLSLLLICVLLLPCAFNVIRIIIPYNGVTLLMSFQCWTIFIFALCLIEHLNTTYRGVLSVIICFLISILSWTYIIQANATFECYELSHKYNYNQLSMALDRVYSLDGYEKNETKIVMVGFPNEENLRKMNVIYRYGVNLTDNLAFWQDIHGLTNVRRAYFMNMFGIDAREMDYDEYYYVITSSKFDKMPCWPKKGSVDMIGGYAVVKFTDEPLYPY